MADSNTTVLDLLLMEIDSHENDWGDQANSNFSIIARAIGATVSHAVTTGTVTLSEDNVKDALHRITGTLVGNVTIEVPAAEPKSYFWRNETTGAFTVTIKVTGQTGVVLPQGESRLLRCNGTDVLDFGLNTNRFATVVGGTADAITATFSPTYATYTTTMRFSFIAGGPNTITNPTINVDGLGTKTVKKFNGQALAINDITGSGHVCDCAYNGTDVILLNPSAEPAGQYSNENAQVNTTFTFGLSDKGKFVSGANAGAITWTVPPNSDVAFPLYSRIDWFQKGAGQITFTQGSGVTIRPGNNYKARAQWSAGSLIKIGTNEWLVIGDITA